MVHCNWHDQRHGPLKHLIRMFLCAHMLPPHQEGYRIVIRIIDGRAARHGLPPRESRKEAHGSRKETKGTGGILFLPPPPAWHLSVWQILNITVSWTKILKLKTVILQPNFERKSQGMSKSKGKKESSEIKRSSEPHSDMALYAGHDSQFKISIISMLWVLIEATWQVH